jgi:hypothetical protein
MRAHGAPPEVLARWAAIVQPAQAEPPILEVWPEHWHAWRVFLAMGTQWRRTGDRWDGLDYAALPIVLAEHKACPHRQPLPVLMAQLRQLEHAALGPLNTARD